MKKIQPPDTELAAKNAELLQKLQSMGDSIAAYERSLWAFFSLSDELFCIAEKDGRFKKVNPAWTRALGWSEQEMTENKWLDFVHPEDVEKTMAEAEALLERNAIGFENRYRHKDGSYRNLLWIASHWDKDGLNYAVAREVTRKREAERRLRELQLKSDEINLAVEEILNLLRD